MPSSVSPEQIWSIADSLHINVSQKHAEELAENIAELVEIYSPLDSVGYSIRDRDKYTISDIVFDPDEQSDPYNAFITRFNMNYPNGSEDRMSDLDVAVKDNIAIAGLPMTCGSRVLEAATPQRNATVIDRLVENGARVIGKTNQTEMAFGPAGRHSRYGPMLNPHNQEHLAGGSSGGSGAAVASGEVDAALGSDTGGSVRVPAALCGVVGFKPTWGAIPRYGFVEMAYTLDHIGPLTKDVHTAARVFDVIGGRDVKDPSSHRADSIPIGDCADRLVERAPIAEVSLGVPEEFFGRHVDDQIESRIRETIDEFEDAGANVESVSAPTLELVNSVTNAILVTEFATSYLTRGTPVHRREVIETGWHSAASAAIKANGNQFGDLVKTKAIEGVYLLSEYDGRHYVRARNARATIEQEYRSILEEFDALVTPTVPQVAPRIDGIEGENPDDWALQLVANTRAGNLTGFPAITVPCGAVNGLPVGIQFLGKEYDDLMVLQLGRTVEQFLEENGS